MPTCFFGVSDSEIQTSLLRLRAMETSWKNKISFEASSDMMLSNRRITKAQIGLRGLVLFKSRRQVFSHRVEIMLTPFHGMFFFCLDGLLIWRSKSKFLGTQNTYTSLNTHRPAFINVWSNTILMLANLGPRIWSWVWGVGNCWGVCPDCDDVTSFTF